MPRLLLMYFTWCVCSGCLHQFAEPDPASDPPSASEQGLLLRLTFNETFVDASPLNSTLIPWGTTLTTDRFDRPHHALAFDGQAAYLDILPSTLDALKPNPPLSLATWVRIDEQRGMGLFTTNYDDEVNHGAWLSLAADGRVAINYGNGGRIDRSSRRTKRGDTRLTPGRWYHVVGTIHTTDSLSIYVNGDDDGGFYDGDAQQLAYSDGPASLGRRDRGAGVPPVYFAGALDCVLVYNRALSEAERMRMVQSETC